MKVDIKKLGFYVTLTTAKFAALRKLFITRAADEQAWAALDFILIAHSVAA